MTRIGARRAWFQVHKWIGLILMALLMPISATGTLLLAHDMLGEERARPAPVAAPLPLARYVTAAAPAVPDGARVAGVMLPTAADRTTVTVRAARVPRPGEAPRGGPQRPILVKLDAATAAILPSRGGDQGGGIWMTMHRLHGTLLVPVWGRTIVGWLGVAMLISCISGIWIWWPTVSGFVRGLRWRRGDKLDYNLHHLTGFWIALPLAMLSLSGAWISFPGFFAGLVGEQAPQRMAGGNVPIAAPRQDIDKVAALAGSRGPLAELALPTAASPRWTATLADGKRIAIDDASGDLARPERQRQGPVARWMRSVHEGAESTGPVWRAIVLLGGAIPVLLGITGLTMWLRSRRWRSQVARKQAAKRERVAA